MRISDWSSDVCSSDLALSAHSRIEQLAEQAASTGAKVVIVPTDQGRRRFEQCWSGTRPLPEIRVGAAALAETAADPQVPTVMAAMVGDAGLDRQGVV